MEIINNTDKEIKGIKGTMKFYDMFGDLISVNDFKYDEQSIPGRHLMIYEAWVEHNQFMDSSIKLMQTDVKNIKMVWEEGQIIYAE